MFELFKRVKTVVSAELNDFIDKAEDPEKMVDQFLREMEKDIHEAEKTTAKMIAEEKLLSLKVDEAKSLIAKREDQAIDALKTENEDLDLARRALEDKARVKKELEQLQALHEDTARTAEELKEKLLEMKSEYREMELKRTSLKARANSAKAKSALNRSFSTINSDGSKKGFERMEEKILRLEAEAELTEEQKAFQQSLDSEFEKLRNKTGIDLELEQLKEKIQQPKE
ncbi:PspA/IM30 family protein [Fictibacillus gelatini]|uniref:PspA/IM30 family protein n=1 Tax=Fictibacillus gelatini TaxID=225985 RepID=UPI000405D304|nr:PspA/IM30 family protein [Fictibacillus gelatini]